MSLANVAAFWGVSLLFVLTPGADWAYAITAGLRDRSVLPAVAGLLSGHLAATVVVAAGVAALVARSPLVLIVLTVLGAVYLLWLGQAMLRSHATLPADDDLQDTSSAETPWPRRLAQGAGVSGLNPKVFLLFLALLPQFTDAGGSWPIAAQIIALGLVHIASCAVVYLAVGLAARRVLRARPGAARIVTRVSGAAMIVIATVLLVEQLLHLHG